LSYDPIDDSNAAEPTVHLSACKRRPTEVYLAEG